VSSWTQRPPVDLPLILSSCVSRKHHGCNFPILHESHVSCPWVQMGEFITCIHRFAYDSYTFRASLFLPIRLTFTYVVSKALYFYGPAIRRRSKFSRMVMEGQWWLASTYPSDICVRDSSLLHCIVRWIVLSLERQPRVLVEKNIDCL
jgi:hypothetical protein